MFERVITQTIQKISSEVLRERASIPLTDILEDERVPARLKPFFATEVRWWLYNEEMARAANKRFDYDHPELASLLNYLEQVQFRHARFERDEFLGVLDSAVKLTYNYLCRPQTTLKWYIFRGQPVKPLREVLLRFDAFVDYEYFGAVFSEWMERKRRERPTFEAISATEFERIIRRTDDQILLSCTVEELIGLMDPIFDFVGEGDDRRVPLDALVIFFDDKNIARLVDHLERFRQRGFDTVGREDFVGILDELLTTAEENPEADFSSVYQNDELDDVVRRHLQAEGRPAGETTAAESPAAEPPAVAASPERGSAALPVAEPFEAASQMQHEELKPEPSPIDNTTADSPREEPTAESEPIVEERSASSAREPASASHEDEEPRPEPEFPIYTMSDLSPEEAKLLPEEPEPFELPRIAERREPAPEPSSPLQHASPEFEGRSETEIVTQTLASDDTFEATPEPEIPAPTPVADHDSESIEPPTVEGRDEPAGETEAREANRGPEAKNGLENGRPAPAGASGLRDVRQYIDAMLERKIIKKIFNRDRSSYEQALDRLNEADDWKKASQILDEIFIRHDIDPYSRTALRFMDSIYGRYLPNK